MATFSRNQILNIVNLYWLNGKVLSATRIYYENRVIPESKRTLTPITFPAVPTVFFWEPFASGAPSSLIDATNYANIKLMNDYPKGGHFSAMEQPEL